jgi:16S rRNA (cytosine1402-N4)-methyltransferase
MSNGHVPVMAREAVHYLRLKAGMTVVDATLGCGGHAEAILEGTGPSGVLIGIDWDADALRTAKRRLSRFGDRVRIHRESYTGIADVAAQEGRDEVDAVLFDLGVSSLQLDAPARGFSFRRKSPIDMRMDRRRNFTGQHVLQQCTAGELAGIIKKYGEEPLAGAIAKAIKREPVSDTERLAEIVREVYRRAGRRVAIDPATKVFQALRIAVNDEIERLRAALPRAVEILKKGGRIVCISFHSLEDRVVKQTFARYAKGCTCPPGFPVCRCGGVPVLRVVLKRPERPAASEVAVNPRARSARLRAAEKV